jgi:ABC-2 type transport system permease protein
VSTVESPLTRPLGRPIQGPTALGSDPRRLWHLAWSIAVTDFKLRFFGSVLGYLWQLMRPLMLFGVLYVVFTTVFDLGNEVKYYPVALLLGIVLYSFINEATSASVRSLVMRENLVRKIEFPRLAVPLATALTALFNLGLNLIPVFVFLVAAGGSVRWSWLELPVLVVFLAILATGLAMLLSALFVRYRDVEPIWDVVLQVAFYATPIIYPIQTVITKGGPGLARAMMCNPFAAIVQQARHAVVDPSHLSTAAVLGSKLWLLVPLGITFAIFALGFTVFSHMAPRIAEDL